MELQPERQPDPIDNLEPVLILPDMVGRPVCQAIPVLNAMLEASPGVVTVTLNGDAADNSVASDRRKIDTQTPAYSGNPIEVSSVAFTAAEEDPEFEKIKMPNFNAASLIPTAAGITVLQAICRAIHNDMGFEIKYRDELGDEHFPPFEHSQRVRTTVPAPGGPVYPGDTVAVIIFDIGAGKKPV